MGSETLSTHSLHRVVSFAVLSDNISITFLGSRNDHPRSPCVSALQPQIRSWPEPEREIAE